MCPVPFVMDVSPWSLLFLSIYSNFLKEYIQLTVEVLDVSFCAMAPQTEECGIGLVYSSDYGKVFPVRAKNPGNYIENKVKKY